MVKEKNIKDLNGKGSKKMMKPLRGRLLVQLTPQTHIRPSGLIIVDRKHIAERGTVIAVGATSMKVNGKPKYAPCKVGDVVIFKRYTAMTSQKDMESLKEGIAMLWFDDIIAVVES